jgi:hypothetical protein
MPVPVAPKRINLQLKMLDIEGKPLSAAPCQLDYGPPEHAQFRELTTDSDGMLKFWIPAGPAGRPAFLTFFPGDELVTMELEVTDFGEAHTVSGARARLNNLGYMALRDSERVDAAIDDKLTRALDRFRFVNRIVDANHLPKGSMTAPFDQQTADRLSDAHDGGGPLLIRP